jgi:hypothetical protein
MADNMFSFDSESLAGILMRFGVNLVFIFILIRLIYFRYSKKEKFLFTFFLIGIIIFFICSLLRKVEIGVGMGLGLFAIFAILRFRTRNFSVKDMSYIFTTIGISVINAFSTIVLSFSGVLIINTIIILSVLILELYLQNNSFSKHSIIYDNLELIKPAKYQELLKNVSERTGKDILKIEIRKIDYKKAVADLDIFFKD